MSWAYQLNILKLPFLSSCAHPLKTSPVIHGLNSYPNDNNLICEENTPTLKHPLNHACYIDAYHLQGFRGHVEGLSH